MFVSYKDSVINMGKVANLIVLGEALYFYGNPTTNQINNSNDPSDSLPCIDIWYFKTEEEAQKAFELILEKLEAIKIK